MKAKQRNSGIELLRIIAMLMIISYHVVQHSDITLQLNDSFLITFFNILGSFGKVGVGIFFIISGYYMAQSKSFSYKKILPIARKTWFYSLSIFFLLLVVEPTFVLSQPMSKALSSFFPILTSGYWFVSQLVIIRLLYPYMRRWFDQMSDSDIIKCFAIITAALIIPSQITIPIGGYTSFIFVLPEAFFYSFLGYLIYRFRAKITNKLALSILLLSLFFVILLALTKTADDIMLFISSDFPLCILLSASLFQLFASLNFKSKLINSLGSLVFGVYLIHDNNYIRTLLWQNDQSVTNIISSTATSPIEIVAYTLLAVLSIFICCALIESIRQAITTIIINHFPNKKT